MASTNCNPSDCLVDDVLIVIFKQFSEQDLQNCEATCRRWRAIIQSLYPSRAKFRKKMSLSPLPRAICKKLVPILKKIGPRGYEDVYKATSWYVKEVDRNWLHGKYRQSIYRNFSDPQENSITMGDGYIAYRLPRPPFDFKIVDRRSMKITQSISPPFTDVDFVSKNTLISWDKGNIGIYEIKGNQLICKQEMKYGAFRCCSGHGILTASSYDKRQLTVWRIVNSWQLIELKQWTFEFEIFNLRVDEKFIHFQAAIKSYSPRRARSLYFISTETLEVHRSLSLWNKQCLYDNGLLLVRDYNHIVIMDVKSGTYLRRLPLPWEPFEFKYKNIKMNSRYMIFKKKNDRFDSTIFIYDLESFKNSTAAKIRYYTIEVVFGVNEMLVDELEIICLGKDDYSTGKKMMVLDFSEVDPDSSELTPLTRNQLTGTDWSFSSDPIYYVIQYNGNPLMATKLISQII